MSEEKQAALSSEDGFLGRWSRRKQAAREEELSLELSTKPTDTMPESSDMSPPVITEPEKVLTDADMPPVESLDEHSDYRGFLSKGVSTELRTLALRKLFRKPQFNMLDGLNEYDLDYTQHTPLGDMLTHEWKRWQAKEKEREEAKQHQPLAQAETTESAVAEPDSENTEMIVSEQHPDNIADSGSKEEIL